MVTKRQLGVVVIGLSVLAVLGILAVDSVGAGRWGGFGPLQRIGLGLGAIAVTVGSILACLGDRPA